MIEPDKYWVSSGQKIDDIINTQDIIMFDWSKNQANDYIKLSESFYNAAQIIVTEIVDNYTDNTKCDQWFFPALYLYRQAIELLCKGLLIAVVPRKEITEKLTTYKHNIIELFNDYCNISNQIQLSNDELIWVRSYLSELEIIDRDSDLFRYPIKDGYLSQYKNDFLDIVDMGNTIDQCYSIVFKCVDTKYDPLKYSKDIDLTLKPNVLFFASHGFGNCMLYASPWDEGYYSYIRGFSDIAYFLADKLDKSHWSFLPVAFLVRHAIELALKSILLSRTETNVKEIVLKANHPKYLDNAQTAISVWKNEIEAKKVIIGGHYDSVYSDDHIMKISTSDEEVNGNGVEYISAVDIYFYRFDEAVSFEEALDIIATYLPKEKIQQYFKEEMSVSEPTDTGNGTRYAKFYELKNVSDSDIPQMSDSFGVMVWVDENGNATEARIDYVVYGPFDDETMDVWDYNYFS